MQGMFFGSINSGGGGGGATGDFFWKFIAGAAGDIELKTANGITGIYALNPTEPHMNLVNGTSALGPFPFTGAEVVDGNIGIVSGITKQGGKYYYAISASPNGGTDAMNLYVDSSVPSFGFGVDDGVVRARFKQLKASMGAAVEDMIAQSGIELLWLKDALKFEVRVLNFVKLVVGWDANRFIITDGTFQRFGITKDGNIQTDQATIAAGNDNIPFQAIEVFDVSGGSEGFLTLTLNPGTAHYATPGIAAGAGLGAAGSAVAIVGNDLCGEITVTAGLLPVAGGIICTVTFAAAFVLTSRTTFSASNIAAAALGGATGIFVQDAAGTFTLQCATGSLIGGTVYKWNYQVQE